MIQNNHFISELFKDIQDAILLILHCRTNVIIPCEFFQYIYHVGCAFNLHSIINSGLIPGGRSSSKRQTVFFLPVDPMDKSHKDPDVIDLNVPRRAQYLHNAWKRHQDAVFLGRHRSCDSERIAILSDSIKCNHPSRNLPAYCIPKVVRLKTGEVLYDKVYMSPRPPPKISLKHECKRELGSEVARRPEGEVARQPEGEVARQANFSNQPYQLQIQFVIHRDDLITCKIEETRPVPRRSMLILLAKNSILQTERGDLLKQRKFKHVDLKTGRVSMLNRFMKERGDLLLLLIRQKCKTALEYVLLMKAIRSTLTMKYFVKEWKNPLLIMTRVMNQWWWTRQTWTSEFQDYHIPLWNTRKVPAFDNWFRKSRTQIDILFKKIYDRINHLILSVQNQSKWFGMLRTSSYVNYSWRNPKRSAKYAYHAGTLVSFTARAGTSCIKKERKISNTSIIRWTFFQFLSTSSRKDDLMDIDMVKSRETGNTLRLTQLKKRCKKKYFQGIHDRFIRDPEFRNQMIDNHREEELCRRWDALADEDHTHHLTSLEKLSL